MNKEKRVLRLGIFKSIILLIGLYLLITAISVAITVLMSMSFNFQNNFDDVLMITLLSLTFAYGIFIAAMRLRYDLPLNFARYQPVMWRHIVWFAILSFLLIYVGLHPLINRLPISENQEIFSELSADSPLLALLLILVIAPIFEEIIFRGIILGGLLKKYSPPVAILISALLFGAFHLTFTQFVAASIIGIVLGAIYYKTKSLRYVIAFHFIYNISVSFLGLLFLDILPNTFLSIVVLLVSLALFWYSGKSVLRKLPTAPTSAEASDFDVDMTARYHFYQEAFEREYDSRDDSR